jgi:polyhydroxyalkanoate synthesis regulator protein
MYGDQMQSVVPLYLEASMDAFRRNQEQFRTAFTGLMGGNAPASTAFETLVRQNMQMMQAAAEMWRNANPLLGATVPPRSEPDNLQDLRDELAALKARLDKMSQG